MKCMDKCVETGMKVTNLFMRNNEATKDAKTADDFISYHNQDAGQRVSLKELKFRPFSDHNF